MKTDSGKTTSVWMSAELPPVRSGLAEDLLTDVCVVGAGIAGLTTAYLLVKEGRRVVVLDDGAVGDGETARTTAHLASALDDRYFELERLHGREGARLAAESHAAAIDRVEAIAAAEGIACDFARVDGYLFLAPRDSEELLDRELEAGRRAGLALEKIARAPGVSFDTGPCLRFPDQAQFHPLKYLAGLVRAIQEAGSTVVSGARVVECAGGAPARVTTHEGRVVTCEAIVVATNVPVNDRVVIHTKQSAYRSYVIGCPTPEDAVPDLLLWDTGDPYHYVRMHRADGKSVLIVGGEDHKTGQEEDMDARWRNLWEWTRERFPLAEPPVFRWSGQILEPVDYLAYIGRNPADDPNVYVATGDSGNGMTHGTIAGMLLTDLIQERANPWAALYDPGRVTLRAAGEFARENANVAGQYADWLKPGDVSSPEQIERGTGAVMRRGASFVAVHRDEGGALHQVSAVCPHLGCIVGWNPGEKTWDCPCHGSRFAADGHVVNGPAHGPLAPAED